MKIIFGILGNETNTFSSDIGTFERWAPNGWTTGPEVISRYRGSPEYAGGMIQAAEEEGVELVPTVALHSAGPLITKEALDFAMGTMCDMIAANLEGTDGVCLGLHGAGAAEGADDLEAYTLQKVREVVGNDMPITVSLDLHGNISEDMVRLSNGLFGIKQYPHIDMAE
ncbi:MAG TPA: M81 family metallopeptidase, partial [Candidatus Ventrousia excrementavium]|nr:M81 family metallopeptidase [Candidatus Ventrousia excrementavium]